jgi:hypothetical protein
MSTLTEVLDSMGFAGLWRSCSFGSMEDVNRDYLELTERLIEVSKKEIKRLKDINTNIYIVNNYLNN